MLEGSITGTPESAATSYLSPASPHQPPWNVLPLSRRYPAPPVNYPANARDQIGLLSQETGVSIGDLPENVAKRTRDRKHEQLEHSRCRQRELDDGRSAMTGDAAGDGVTSGSSTKIIFLGIEKKGKELKRQISGEVRKLAGGKDKGKKTSEFSPRSFVPRIERKVGDNQTGGADCTCSSWRKYQKMDNIVVTVDKTQVENGSTDSTVATHSRLVENPHQEGRYFNIDMSTTPDHLDQSIDDPREHSKSGRVPTEQSRIDIQPYLNGTSSSPTVEQAVASSPDRNSSKKTLSPTEKCVPQTEPQNGVLPGGKFTFESVSIKYPFNVVDKGFHTQSSYTQDSPVISVDTSGGKVYDTNMKHSRLQAPLGPEFWVEADSSLSSTQENSDKWPGDTFWTDADKGIPPPPWKSEGPSLEEWIAGLPGISDGAADSKIFEAKNKLKKRKREAKSGVLRVVNGNAEEDENRAICFEDGNALAATSDQGTNAPAVVVDETSLYPDTPMEPFIFPQFQRLFQPGRLEILPEASRETSLHTPTVIGGVSTSKTLTLLNQGKTETSKIEEELRTLLSLPLPMGKVQRPVDLAREVSDQLEAMDKYWDEQRLTVGTALKRLLWVVDNMVVREREEGQKTKRAQEMGWHD